MFPKDFDEKLTQFVAGFQMWTCSHETPELMDSDAPSFVPLAQLLRDNLGIDQDDIQDAGDKEESSQEEDDLDSIWRTDKTEKLKEEDKDKKTGDQERERAEALKARAGPLSHLIYYIDFGGSYVHKWSSWIPVLLK